MTALILSLLHPLGLCVALLTLTSIAYGFYDAFLQHLRKVPGPLLASLSPFWQVYLLLVRRQHIEYIRLHEKYGPVVRVGPNTVIINDSTYFSAWSKWDMADFWLAFRPDPVHLSHSKYNDVKAHTRQKKLSMGGCQMSAVLKNEFTMDKHISTLTAQIKARSGL
ncbi:hypothetical protein LTR70_004620 [Exophiala xenobiotica]|uniref:Cytochrome P450 n=1 Tax=Lithohypha guttulata TaxID=1690604 RepID=A0ABR0KCT7_9EURO|nr:hypothetical protein LTR24_004123 [Lithohypha guttulata]KAK5320393.1 hypothetical protein LTR70_004620 [Exophiala xenobiotica]